MLILKLAWPLLYGKNIFGESGSLEDGESLLTVT